MTPTLVCFELSQLATKQRTVDFVDDTPAHTPTRLLGSRQDTIVLPCTAILMTLIPLRLTIYFYRVRVK